jgi:hypothetical protein
MDPELKEACWALFAVCSSAALLIHTLCVAWQVFK